ncbi:MAG: hypothetical protein ACLFWM_10210, partial [Actinomycetota bacterium]
MTGEAGARGRRLRLPWMATFLGGRLIWAGITLFIYLTVVFFFVQWWTPIDFASQFAMGGGYEAAAQQYGLDRPLPVRYLEWMGGLLEGDLGESFRGGAVTTAIGSAAPVTVLVFAVGAVIAYVVGEYLGRVAAWRRRTVRGSALSVLGVVSATTFPPFLVFILVRYMRGPMISLRNALG